MREPDGLAMSSRNVLLNTKQRMHAALISQTLFKAKNMMASRSVKEIKDFVVDEITSDEFLQVEYFEIVNDSTLISVENWNQPGDKIGCIAVKVGKIRLVDNISFSL